jgi:hypothetical protein
VASSFTGRPPPAPTFVTPQTAASREPARTGYTVPQGAPELVKTGSEARPSGSDFQIPDWFEAAARKMLADKSGADDRMGLPELTLIGAAATSSTTRLAASTGDTPAPTPSTAAAAPGGSGGDGDEDIEDLAREVYDEICRLQEAARLRSGD